jgi:hypothetical protein
VYDAITTADMFIDGCASPIASHASPFLAQLVSWLPQFLVGSGAVMEVQPEVQCSCCMSVVTEPESALILVCTTSFPVCHAPSVGMFPLCASPR